LRHAIHCKAASKCCVFFADLADFGKFRAGPPRFDLLYAIPDLNGHAFWSVAVKCGELSSQVAGDASDGEEAPSGRLMSA